MRKISMLPSILTLCNFSCGIISISLCIQSIYLQSNNLKGLADNYFLYGCYVIIIGMIFDMLDGRVARMTHSQSQFGAELDSLADVCTFGIAPGILLFTVWVQNIDGTHKWWNFALFAAILYSICGVIRLAIYNLSSSETPKDYFSGLPSPAAAGAVVSTILFAKEYCVDNWVSFFNVYLSKTWLSEYGSDQTGIVLLGLYTIVIGLLMVSPFKFAHAANILLGKTKTHWVLLTVVIMAYLLIEYTSIFFFLVFNGFILFCICINIKNKLKNKEHNIHKDMEDILSLDGTIEKDSEINPK